MRSMGSIFSINYIRSNPSGCICIPGDASRIDSRLFTRLCCMRIIRVESRPGAASRPFINITPVGVSTFDFSDIHNGKPLAISTNIMPIDHMSNDHGWDITSSSWIYTPETRASGGIYSGVTLCILPVDLKLNVEPKSMTLNSVGNIPILFTSMLSNFRSACTILC